MKRYLNETTRITVGIYLPALSFSVFKLQRKQGWRWRTTSWNYASLLNDTNLDYTVHWLLWAEPKKHKDFLQQPISDETLKAV